MTLVPGVTTDGVLDDSERQWLLDVVETKTLGDLVELLDAPTEHEAYFRAKTRWKSLHQRLFDARPQPVGFPGDCIVIDGQECIVHGITHTDTPEERQFVQDHVEQWLAKEEDVYCEQGIRPLYFDSYDDVCEMDDYSWAVERATQLDDTALEDILESGFDEGNGNVDAVVERIRDVAFSLIDSSSDIYGDRFAQALGDVASDLLMSHEAYATGDDFRSFDLSRRAAREPAYLGELQRYYWSAFLPQPLEREWLRRHNYHLELFTHARNERLADYAVFHADSETVRLIVGAAHQPGVVYYLQAHRDGDRDASQFEFLEED